MVYGLYYPTPAGIIPITAPCSALKVQAAVRMQAPAGQATYGQAP